jgi:hypothetical protein
VRDQEDQRRIGDDESQEQQDRRYVRSMSLRTS